MQSVGAACGLVAPNQRRTETGTGTQSPPRTGCPGPTQGGVEFLVLGGQSVGHGFGVGKDSRVHIWRGWWWCPTQDQTVHMNRLSGALHGVFYHHHQWRLKRFDPPWPCPQAL